MSTITSTNFRQPDTQRPAATRRTNNILNPGTISDRAELLEVIKVSYEETIFKMKTRANQKITLRLPKGQLNASWGTYQQPGSWYQISYFRNDDEEIQNAYSITKRD